MIWIIIYILMERKIVGNSHSNIKCHKLFVDVNPRGVFNHVVRLVRSAP